VDYGKEQREWNQLDGEVSKRTRKETAYFEHDEPTNDHIPRYQQVIDDLYSQNQIFQNKINQLQDSSGWEETNQKLLKMQDSIKDIKHENMSLKDEREMYYSQLMTLKNVNESQQKLINFLNESKQEGNHHINLLSENDENDIQDLYTHQEVKNQEFWTPKYQIREYGIREYENQNSESAEYNHHRNPEIQSHASEEKSDGENGSELGEHYRKEHYHTQTLQSPLEKLEADKQNQQKIHEHENWNEDSSEKMTSIEKSRKNYNEIVESFQNIHCKLEEWHQQKSSMETDSYAKLVQQHTAKFDTKDSLNGDDKFLYEFERNIVSRQEQERCISTPNDCSLDKNESQKYKRVPSFAYQEVDSDGNENFGFNFSNTFDSQLQVLKNDMAGSRNIDENDNPNKYSPNVFYSGKCHPDLLEQSKMPVNTLDQLRTRSKLANQEEFSGKAQNNWHKPKINEGISEMPCKSFIKSKSNYYDQLEVSEKTNTIYSESRGSAPLSPLRERRLIQ